MSSTPPPPHTPPPLHYPDGGTRVGHRLRPVAITAIVAVVILIAAAITAAIVLSGTAKRPKPPPMLPSSQAAMTAPATSGIPQPPTASDQLTRTPRTARGVAVALTSADPITIAHGISVTPAPGWTLGNQGPNWVTLYNADSSAQMEVTIEPASGTDVVALLQTNINQLTSTWAGLINVKNLSGPATKTLHSANFQQQASIDYAADLFNQQGAISVLGAFEELLNTSNHQSAFINYRQTGDATTQAASDGGIMIQSML